MNRITFVSTFAALSIASAASAIDVVYDDFLEGKATWVYVDDPTSTPVDEPIGEFSYSAGPAFIDPSFSETENYRWTIDARSELKYSFESLQIPPPFPGNPNPTVPVPVTSSQNSVAAANFSFIATAAELLATVGITPANLFALSSTGLSGSITLDEVQSTLGLIDTSFGGLFSPPADFGIGPSSIALDGIFGLASGFGSLLLSGDIPDLISTQGDAYLDIAITAERIDKPVAQIPDSGSSAAFAIAGLVAIAAARRKTRR